MLLYIYLDSEKIITNDVNKIGTSIGYGVLLVGQDRSGMAVAYAYGATIYD